MNERYLRIACVITLACIVLVTLIGAGINTEEIEIKKLLSKRTDIMENVLSGNISIEEGKAQLKKIEAYKQYNDDVNSLIANMNCEHNKVIDMRIIELERINRISDLVSYESRIIWTCYGIEGIYTQECSYTIGVKIINKELKLVSFELLQ